MYSACFQGRAKPVAFAVKTNVAFDGSMDDDSPVHGSAVSFAIGDYLHVMERYDQNWWIGRKVQVRHPQTPYHKIKMFILNCMLSFRQDNPSFLIDFGT